MHNGQLANPMNSYTKKIKKISGKRSKTDADYEEMARLEFLGGLYLDSKNEPCIPAKVIRGVLVGKGGAARSQKRGKDANRSIFILRDFPLEYEGPRKPDELWENESFRFQELVKVQSSRILRTRPIFRDWALAVTIEYDETLIDEPDVCEWMKIAGTIGIGDWRGVYGRFTVEQE